MIVELNQLPPPVAYAIMHGQVQFADNGRVIADVIKKSNDVVGYGTPKTANEFLERFKQSPYNVADIDILDFGRGRLENFDIFGDD